MRFFAAIVLVALSSGCALTPAQRLQTWLLAHLGLADVVLGTGGMIAYVEKSPVREFVVGTETGMVYRLRKKFPDREFFPATKHALCPNMKKITLEKVAQSLESPGPGIAVEPGIAERARRAIRAMLDVS